jgi:hypothetical protein
MTKSYLIIATLAIFALAVSARVFVEFSNSIQIPNGWKRLDNARSDQKVQLIFALKQRNTDKLEVSESAFSILFTIFKKISVHVYIINFMYYCIILLNYY